METINNVKEETTAKPMVLADSIAAVRNYCAKVSKDEMSLPAIEETLASIEEGVRTLYMSVDLLKQMNENAKKQIEILTLITEKYEDIIKRHR